MLPFCMFTKPLRVHLHSPEMLKMWNFRTVIQFPYKIRHNLVELHGAKTILITVYAKFLNTKIWTGVGAENFGYTELV